MDKLQTVSALSTLRDINMVDFEKIGSGNLGDGSTGVVVQKATSAVFDDRVCAKKRGKGILGYDSEELEVLSKKARIEAFGGSDIFIEIPASSEQVGPLIASPDLIAIPTADSSDTECLSKALKWLSLCKAERDSCEGSSDRSKKVADNKVSLAESLLHAEILLEWVRTRNELEMVKYTLKCKDDNMTKLLNQIAMMERKAKDAAVRHTLVARISMMLESDEARAAWNVREEIEAFKLKFPESNLEDWGVSGVKGSSPVAK